MHLCIDRCMNALYRLTWKRSPFTENLWAGLRCAKPDFHYPNMFDGRKHLGDNPPSKSRERNIRMKIFLSYASQDRDVAQSIHRALVEQGHDVFFDREDLMPSEEFHNHIRRSIERADLFIFLISENAIDPGSYTLNELDIAEKVLKQASGRLLPVLLQPIPFDRLPTFKRSAQ